MELAKKLAYERHEGQTRKNTGNPFVCHLERVVEIAKTMTDVEDIIKAAWLHDIVEDTETELEEIYALFGKRVGDLVKLETEDKTGDPRETWKARKQEQLDVLKNTDDKEVYIIALSDKLANMEELARDLEDLGDSIWDNFNNNNIEDQKWYYYSFAELVKDLSHHEAYSRYLEVLKTVFK